MTHEERARGLVAFEMVLIGFKFEKPFIEAMETRLAAALREVERETLEKVTSIVERIAEYGPEEGTIAVGIACAFCDMGYAGYSERGDGFHDDACAVKDAQILLRALAQKECGK